MRASTTSWPRRWPVPADPAEAAVGFARRLRAAGIDVPVRKVTTFVEALGVVEVDRVDAVYWAGRVTLVSDAVQLPGYDEVFAAYWLGRATGGQGEPEPPPPPVVLAVDDDDEADAGAAAGPELPAVTVRYSPREVLRGKDFAAYSAAEFDEARRLMADIRLGGALRRTRRLVPARGAGRRPDVRRTVRAALRAGGEAARLATLEQSRRPRPVVLLCDVSGSMEPYSRALVRFLHAAVVGRRRVEAFALGTRLTHITRQLRSRDPDAALAAAARAVADWAGGTRLGEGLRAFNDRWGVPGMARGAVVVILSDGWDRGEPEVLAEQMARLHRVAHRIVWVNPLKASPGYAPLARGMAAALPYVDEFVEGHSLASLETLTDVIAK